MPLKIVNVSVVPEGCKFWLSWNERKVEATDPSGKKVTENRLFVDGSPGYLVKESEKYFYRIEGSAEYVPILPTAQVAVIEARPNTKYYKESINFHFDNIKKNN